MNRGINEWMNVRVNERKNEWISAKINQWINQWMNEKTPKSNYQVGATLEMPRNGGSFTLLPDWFIESPI